MNTETLFFIFFNIGIVFVLLLDLLVIGRNAHEVSVKEASVWSIIWITLALSFAIFLWFHAEIVHGITDMESLKAVAKHYNPYLHIDESNYNFSIEQYRKNSTINYLAGYLIEKSLSVDNLFVMMAILNAFAVSKKNYKPVLFWGIIGAIVMRFIFIFAGAAIIEKFEWVLYIFGAYLIYAGVQMYLERNTEATIDARNHPAVKLSAKYLRVFPKYVGNHFLIRKQGLLYITPLLIVLVSIEFTDLIFALDSIPAIFAVTRDPYIVFFSNIFAILGLRSLFFLLIKIVEKFYLLKIGVAILLGYVGVKLILHEWLGEIGFKPVYSLYIILVVLTASIILSVLFPKHAAKE